MIRRMAYCCGNSIYLKFQTLFVSFPIVGARANGTWCEHMISDVQNLYAVDYSIISDWSFVSFGCPQLDDVFGSDFREM